MGQASSTQRGQRQESPLRYSFAPRDHDGQAVGMNDAGIPGQSGGYGSPPLLREEIDQNSIPTLPSRRPPSVSNTFQPSNTGVRESGTMERIRDYEREHRPLAELRHQENRNASLSRLVARRQSTMSRLGSRILPNAVIRGLLNSQEETPAEGHAHRNGRISRSITRSEGNRFTPFSSLSSRGITRRRSIRGPYPLPHGDAALIPDSPPNPTYLDASGDQFSDSNRGSWRRRARLNRVRNSLSAPISQIFGQPSSPQSNLPPRTPPQRPSRSTLPEGADRLFPPLGHMDTRMDYEDSPHELDSVEPAMRPSRPLSPNPSRASQNANGIRRFPSVLRARSSRILRRDEQTPLSRVLQLAAAAIAAQLSGTTGPVMPNIHALGNDGLDGSLEHFIQSLQHVASTQTNLSGSNEAQHPTSEGGPSPVNLLRVFRFVNPDAPRSSTAPGDPSNRGDRMDIDEPAELGPEGRTVTLVVVGVRSVSSSNGIGGDQNNTGVGLDTLLGLPLISPSNVLRDQGSAGHLFRRTDGRTRLSPQRQMMGSGNNTHPANFDNQHHQTQSSLSPGRASENIPPSGISPSIPTVSSESPPGPHPPPSTPAEPGLSRVSSGTTTPSRRPSSASGNTNVLPQLHEDPSRQPTVESAEEDPSFASTRQRRRSDSEFARHRHLGSGAARRNGVVEPDHPAPPTGRTWLIYVVGTNLSENHPAFATPSLFTDNPTYEDMILLSSLLGPAKPPVASQADVTSAGGLFHLVEYAGSLVAEALSGIETIPIGESERCLICLSDYEAAEEVRQLARCKHIFHKDCIDQWLMTGRNSCPLCRGQGVTESPDDLENNNSAPISEALA